MSLDFNFDGDALARDLEKQFGPGGQYRAEFVHFAPQKAKPTITMILILFVYLLFKT